MMNWKLRIFRNARAARLSRPPSRHVAEDVVIKVWSRADRSGPLRAGNIVAAGDTLNKMLAAIGSDKRVKIELNETNAKGYDDDALDLLKAFAVDKGPDIFVLAHEWTGAFAEAGYAQNLEDHIAKNPELYGDIIVPLWQSVSYKGARYGVPQDSEVRMYLPEQRQAAQARQERQGHRCAARPRWMRASSPPTILCDLAGQAVPEGRGEIRHPPSPERGTRFPDADGTLRPGAVRQAGGQAAGIEGGVARTSTRGSNTASTRRRFRRTTPQCRGTRSSRRRSAARKRWSSFTAYGASPIR